MDNSVFNVAGTGDISEVLILAFKLLGGRTAKGYLIKEKVLIPVWCTTESDGGALKLPAPLTAAQFAPIAQAWLAEQEFPSCRDHDVDEERGWRIFVEQWGHVKNSPYAICGIEPFVAQPSKPMTVNFGGGENVNNYKVGDRMTNNEKFIKSCVGLEGKVREVFLGLSKDKAWRLIHAAFGMQTEAGEFTDHLKRVIFYGKEADRTNMIEELGDMLWYIAIACDTLSVSLEEVMLANMRKLQARYPNNFSSDAALNRDLEEERKALDL